MAAQLGGFLFRGNVLATQVASLFGVLSLRDDFTPTLDKAEGKLTSFSGKMKSVGQNMKSVGRTMTLAAAPFVAFGAASLKSSLDFQQAMAGVNKTVNLTESELAELSARFRQMAIDPDSLVSGLKNAQVTLANLGQIAGQLGVRGVDDIAKFSETMALLSITTNLTASGAAVNMARFANVMDFPIGQVDKLANTIVNLGNNFETSEREILSMATRMAPLAAAAGFTADEVFGLSAALSAAGIQAQVGGSNVGIALNRISRIVGGLVDDSAEKLEILGRITGQTGEQFSQLWDTDTAAAFFMLIEGFEGAAASGENLTILLDSIDIKNIRTQRLFTALAGATGDAARGIDLAAASIDNLDAITREAEIFSATGAVTVERLKNQFRELKISVGDALLPVLIKLANTLGPIIISISKWVQAHPNLTAAIFIAAAAVGALGAVLFTVGSIIAVAGSALAVLGGAAGIATVAAGAATFAIGGLGAAATILAGILAPALLLGAVILIGIELIKMAGGFDQAWTAAKQLGAILGILSIAMADTAATAAKQLIIILGTLVLHGLDRAWTAFKQLIAIVGELGFTGTLRVVKNAIISLIDLGLDQLRAAVDFVGGVIDDVFGPGSAQAIVTFFNGFINAIQSVMPSINTTISALRTLANLVGITSNSATSLPQPPSGGSGGGSSGGSLPPWVTLPPIFSFDHGGDIGAGQTALIGTGAQPELYTPKTAGTMTPNAGGMGNVTVTLNVTEGNARSAGMNFADGLAAKMRSKGLRPI